MPQVTIKGSVAKLKIVVAITIWTATAGRPPYFSATLGTALVPGTDIFAPLIRDQAGRTAFGEPINDCTRTYLGSFAVWGSLFGIGSLLYGKPVYAIALFAVAAGSMVAIFRTWEHISGEDQRA